MKDNELLIQRIRLEELDLNFFVITMDSDKYPNSWSETGLVRKYTSTTINSGSFEGSGI
jgi:hypothetical protein